MKSRTKLQEEHDCLRQILKQFTKIHNEGGIETMVMGKKVVVLPWIHILGGDASGQNVLCCVYNNHGNTFCPYRACLCPFGDLASTRPRCQPRSIEVVEDHRRNGTLGDISMHNVRSAFQNVPVSDVVNGAPGIVPGEDMHAIAAGVGVRML
jgi:hypothetical protein